MDNKSNTGLRSPLIDSSDEKITVSHIYKLNCSEHDPQNNPGPNNLKKMFSMNKNESLQFLKDHNGSKGVLGKLASDENTGIVGDEKDLNRRRQHFGANLKPLAQQTKLWDSIKQTLHEPIWKWLVISATLAAVVKTFALWSIESLGEGFAIIFSTFMLIFVTACADYTKDKRFIELQSLIKDGQVPVVRGKQSATQSVSIWDLVVGDIILLETGSRVPADCLVLEGSDLKVCNFKNDTDDQGNHELHGEVKGPQDQSNPNADPILFSGSKIVKGNGKALVCCVGKQSSLKQGEAKSLGIDEDTPVQVKLHNLESQFVNIALWAAIIILIFFGARLAIEVALYPETRDFATGDPALNKKPTLEDLSADDFQYISGGQGIQSKLGIIAPKLISLINIIIVLIVVSIPDGLPLVIGVSLAFSVKKMYLQKILIRNLEAPEKMGGIQEICCGKTGTLTKNEMKVTQFFTENRLIINNRKDTLLKCDLSGECLMRIQESMLYNCDARVEMDDVIYAPVGNGTEVGLLKFLQDADIPIHILINKKFGNILMRSPHSPENKRSAVALKSPDRPDTVTIYIKGAPEQLLNYCSKILQKDRVSELGQDEEIEVLKKVNTMAMQPLRVIGMAYLELSVQQWEQNFTHQQNSSSEIFDDKLNKFEKFFTWIGAFGLRDTLRPGVIDAIKYARDDAKLNVRLISGDHIETAKAIAIKSGILRDKEQLDNSVMEGSQFRQLVGNPLIEKMNPETQEIEPTDELEKMYEFDAIIENLKVLARATPLDKEILIRGLKFRNKLVAVTGDGISDVKCLQTANVGLAMGSGCSVAKEAADIIITDDDFEANIQAVMWGRNIFLNIQRFLQFQVTVNFSCLLTVLIGGMMIGESPFSAVQLLWINLIMDTFAAIALSTEPPIKSVTAGEPFRAEAKLMTPAIWRQVIGVSAWNTIVMTVMFVYMVLNENYLAFAPMDKKGEDYLYYDYSLYKRQSMTKIFNCFIFLQIFNFINCRKVGANDFNVFESFFHNGWFLGIFFGTFTFQIIFCCYFPGISKTEPMDRQEWGACIAMGSSNLIISSIVKLVTKFFKNKIDKMGEGLPTFVNEDKQIESKLMSQYNKLNEPQDTKGKTTEAGSDNEETQVDDENKFEAA